MKSKSIVIAIIGLFICQISATFSHKLPDASASINENTDGLARERFPHFVSITIHDINPAALGSHNLDDEPVWEPKHYCSGSIFSEEWIIAAALMVKVNLAIYRIVIAAGPVNGHTRNSLYGVERVYPHPKFDHYSLANNIALLKVERSIVMNRWVQPIALFHEFVGADHPGLIVRYNEVSIVFCCCCVHIRECPFPLVLCQLYVIRCAVH